MRVALGVAMATAMLAGGCRQSEEDVRAELRAQFLQRCQRDLAPSAAAAPGFDTERFCGCVTDKAIGERSLDDVRALFADGGKSAALGRQAGVECQQTDMVDAAPALPPAPVADTDTDREAEEREQRERERERERARARNQAADRPLEPPAPRRDPISTPTPPPVFNDTRPEPRPTPAPTPPPLANSPLPRETPQNLN